MRKPALFLFVVLLLSLSCQVVRTPVADSTSAVVTLPALAPAAPFVPPAVYGKWWADIEACSGLGITKGAMDSIQFMYVAAPAFRFTDTPAGVYFIGYSDVWDGKLYLALEHTADRKIVEHEMLHFLMWENGVDFGHPSSLFVRCGVR